MINRIIDKRKRALETVYPGLTVSHFKHGAVPLASIPGLLEAGWRPHNTGGSQLFGNDETGNHYGDVADSTVAAVSTNAATTPGETPATEAAAGEPPEVALSSGGVGEEDQDAATSAETNALDDADCTVIENQQVAVEELKSPASSVATRRTRVSNVASRRTEDTIARRTRASTRLAQSHFYLRKLMWCVVDRS